ncbi:MAG: hypothetical protein KAR40_18480 [Candidatus Sabulitectum sp.]|nr:hypothetical protein [Candidatus Sabulitectum sp.]
MKNCILVIITSLLAVSAALGNGGPFETSPVFGAGEAGPMEFVQRDVEIVSEDLKFTPGISFVKVEVTFQVT